jgi:hypothetical protein
MQRALRGSRPWGPAPSGIPRGLALHAGEEVRIVAFLARKLSFPDSRSGLPWAGVSSACRSAGRRSCARLYGNCRAPGLPMGDEDKRSDDDRGDCGDDHEGYAVGGDVNGGDASQDTGTARRRAGRPGQDSARGFERPLRLAAGPRGAAGPGPAAFPQAGRPADARPGPAGTGRQAVEEDHDPRPGRCGESRPDQTRLHRRRLRGEHPLVRGHHLHRDLGRLALPGRGHRHRLPAGRRLRHDRPPAHRTDRGRAVQRGRRTGPGARRGFPLRPRLQHTSAAYAALADECEVALSVGRTGQCWDNALAESFFSTLKGELIDTRTWPTRAGARRAVVEYIGWYNGTRLHSSLGYRSPAAYENNHHENVRQVA